MGLNEKSKRVDVDNLDTPGTFRSVNETNLGQAVNGATKEDNKYIYKI